MRRRSRATACCGWLPCWTLMAIKLKVPHDRVSAKNHIDLAALIEHGVPLSQAMAAARVMYGPAFEPAITLKAMTWFKGGDLESLDAQRRNTCFARSTLSVAPGSPLKSPVTVCCPILERNRANRTVIATPHLMESAPSHSPAS